MAERRADEVLVGGQVGLVDEADDVDRTAREHDVVQGGADVSGHDVDLVEHTGLLRDGVLLGPNDGEAPPGETLLDIAAVEALAPHVWLAGDEEPATGLLVGFGTDQQAIAQPMAD